MRMGLARQLADVLDAEHVSLADVSADALTSLVRERVPRHSAEGAA
jgi:Mg-chelatase subunit ChlD